jgi:hypothetical protein
VECKLTFFLASYRFQKQSIGHSQKDPEKFISDPDRGGKKAPDPGSGTQGTITRNFLQDPDPYLEVMDPDSDPKLDLYLTKNHQKISNLITTVYDIKIH